ncbi:hypothetical protein [Rheinheimera fenheensis]|uniref:hypothetical protein n=1 Tax=Rheinheimera fenheensis TaxID=3152295 RepID=UPI00325DD2E2
MAKKKVGTKKVNSPSPVQIFMRSINSNRVLRNGLAGARTSVEVVKLPEIVQSLGKQSVYRSLFAQITFPKSLEKQTTKRRLSTISIEGELIWTASVLSIFKEQLKEFVKLREEFYKKYLLGDIELALSILDKIQDEYGYSLWLVSHRLQIIQSKDGLQAQKEYLENIISTKGIDGFFSFLSYYLSVRAENGVTYDSFHNQVLSSAPNQELVDHLICNLIPFNAPEIHDIANAIAWNENHCIIDRYESLILLGLIHYSREKSASKNIIYKSFSLLLDTNDPLIINITNISKGHIEPDPDEIKDFDYYTIGDYSNIDNNNIFNIELIAKSYAMSGITPPDGESLLSKTVILMYKILTASKDTNEAKDSLKKISLVLSGNTISYQIMSFLNRTHNFIFVQEYCTSDYANAIAGMLQNPWHSDLLSELSNTDWLEKICKNNPHSPSTSLRKSLKSRSMTEINHLASKIPEYRLNSYIGHIELLNENYQESIKKYIINIESSNPYVKLTSYQYLFNAHYNQKLYDQAMHLVVNHALKNFSASRNYPLDKLAEICRKNKDLHSDPSLAIMLSIASRNGFTKYERDISDVYENVLSNYGVSYPSELILIENDMEKSILVYFLRYICIPRVMDDSTCFDGMDEIDSERIKICQYLLKTDEDNKNVYLSEIRQITKDKNVALLLKKVQTSKIYVDDAGIRQSLEPILKSLYAQYKELLFSPELAYQTEKLSKIIGDMLSGKGHPEFKDLKLPATERESLFTTMVDEAVAHFAINPAYGLDTHVSTAIRHGSFEGNLRSPLGVENLLVKTVGSDGELIVQQVLKERLSELSSSSQAEIIKSLSRFTIKFETLVQSYLKNKLHIRTTDHKQGMFVFEGTPEKVKTLYDSITTSTEYDTLVDNLIEYCWDLTDSSLAEIRTDLMVNASNIMGDAFEQLISSIEKAAPHEAIAHLLDSIARARTEFQSALQGIADWFQKPTDLVREPFEFESAIQVALQQIKNCYLTSPLELELSNSANIRLEGDMLDGICEILFILLQNAIIHSGFENSSVKVKMNFVFLNNELIIEISNKLSSEVSTTERAIAAKEAEQQYERDSALRKARMEGGSGLSKIWRIAEYKLKAGHSINLNVDESNCFITQLSLNNLKLVS